MIRNSFYYDTFQVEKISDGADLSNVESPFAVNFHSVNNSPNLKNVVLKIKFLILNLFIKCFIQVLFDMFEGRYSSLRQVIHNISSTATKEPVQFRWTIFNP